VCRYTVPLSAGLQPVSGLGVLGHQLERSSVEPLVALVVLR
jgi:hypothetical protein